MPVAKILVVEDEGLTAMELQRKLKFWGYEVPTFAFSRKEAVKKAEKIKPDLILMDIVLKGEGDGIDAVNEIKNELDIPIIYLTAYSDEKTLKRADSTEPFDYIMKPFEENTLHRSIEKALQRHKFEKKLKEMGESLNKRVKQSGAAVIVTDKDGSIKYINNAAQTFTGLKMEEIHIRNINEVFRVRKLSENTTDGIYNVIESESPLKSGSDEIVLSCLDGKEIPVEYNVSPIKDADGETLGSTLILKDITEQLSTEKTIRESEKRFKTIYSQSPMGIELFDSEGNLLEANDAALDLFGVDNITKLNDFNLFKDFKLEDNEKETLLKGELVRYEIEFDFDTRSYETTKSGSVDLEIIFKPLETEGERSYLVQLHNTTRYRKMLESLKNSKDNYKGILSSFKFPFVVLDSDLNCTYSNNDFENFTNIPCEEIINKSVWNILPSFKNQKEVEETLTNSMKTKIPGRFDFVYELDDERKMYEMDVRPFEDGLSILVEDVTSEKAMEHELKNSEKLYHNLVENLTQPICCFDSRGIVTFANKSYHDYFGDTSIGSSFVFSIPSEEQKKMREYLGSFYEAEPIKILESPVKMPNGNLQWWKWATKAYYDDEGNVTEFTSLGYEVTAERELEGVLNSTIDQLEKKVSENAEYYESSKKSLETKLTEKVNELQLIKERSQKLDEDLNKASEELIQFKEDLQVAMDYRKDLEKAHLENMDKLKKEFEESEVDHEKSISKLQNQLKARMKIEEDLNSKNQLLQADIEDVSSELSTTRKTMELEINKHEESEKLLKEMANDLEMHVETKNSALERVNKDLNNEIVLRKKVENKHKETVEKLNKELDDKNTEFTLKVNELDNEILELNNKLNETSKSLKEKENLLKDVHNRVKRNMQRISSLTGLQSEYMRDQILENFVESQNHIKSIALVHEKLYESPDLERVDFSSYVNALVEDIYRSQGVDSKRIVKEILVDDVLLDIDTATSCGLIINELVSNSIKHAFPDGRDGLIRIEIARMGEQVSMEISDDGVGFPDKFDFEDVDTLGLQLVNTLVDEMEGKIQFKNIKGSEFILNFNQSNVSL